MGDFEDIKVGDSITVCSHYGIEILRVEHVTPSGRFTLTNKTRWTPNGSGYGEPPWAAPRWIRRATPADFETVRQSEALNRLRQMAWHTIAPELRDEILALIDPPKESLEG